MVGRIYHVGLTVSDFAGGCSHQILYLISSSASLLSVYALLITSLGEENFLC